jgi:hypothetical protein
MVRGAVYIGQVSRRVVPCFTGIYRENWRNNTESIWHSLRSDLGFFHFL